MKVNGPFLFWLTQFISWPIFFIWSKVFLNLEVRGRENLKNISGPLIIVANHPSLVDSFMFRIALGPFTNLLPFRFLCIYEFDYPLLKFLKKIGLVWLVYKIFGTIPVTRGKGMEIALAESKKVIEKGGIVVIYPEGSINNKQDLLPFRRGATTLAQMTGASILPVAICANRKKFQRTKFIFSFGKIESTLHRLPPDQSLANLYAIVSRLYSEIK